MVDDLLAHHAITPAIARSKGSRYPSGPVGQELPTELVKKNIELLEVILSTRELNSALTFVYRLPNWVVISGEEEQLCSYANVAALCIWDLISVFITRDIKNTFVLDYERWQLRRFKRIHFLKQVTYALNMAFMPAVHHSLDTCFNLNRRKTH